MAYLVRRKNGSWEIRESRHTEKGPRSRTLATFREATPEVVRRAIERSDQGLLERELIVKLDEAGIPLPSTDADRAARALLIQIASGMRPSEVLRRALLEELGAGGADGADRLSPSAVDPGQGAASVFHERSNPSEHFRRMARNHPPSIERERGPEDPGTILEDVIALAEALPYDPKPDIAQLPIRDLIAESKQVR